VTTTVERNVTLFRRAHYLNNTNIRMLKSMLNIFVPCDELGHTLLNEQRPLTYFVQCL